MTICTTCNDTHMMLFGEYHDEVMCTHCPMPCQRCRAGGHGAFCETTPCPCDCHAGHPAYPYTVPRGDGQRERIQHLIQRVRGSMTALEAALGSSTALGQDTAQTLALAAVELARYCAIHDEEKRR